jgi:hypothetical protein
MLKTPFEHILERLPPVVFHASNEHTNFETDLDPRGPWNNNVQKDKV